MRAPFGVSQFTTWPQSFEEDLELVRGEGIPAIEVCEAKIDPARRDEQLARLKDSGLRVASIQPRLHSLFPDQPRPEPRDPRERMKFLRQTIEDLAPHFPGVTFVSISGAAPAGNYAEAYRTAVREYRELAKIAGDHGVRLALEPLNPILMNVDTFLCSLSQALAVIEEVDEAAFGLFADVWHIWEDAGAEALLRGRAAGRIFGVHINDWRLPRAIGDRHLPGDGVIPLESLLRAIRDSGYEGFYTLEIFSELSLPDSLWRTPATTVREGLARFETLWHRLCA